MGGNPFGDIFSEMFGGRSPFGGGFDFGFGGGQRQPQRKKSEMPIDGKDRRFVLNVTLEESYYGCQKEFKIKKLDTCHKCKGFGGTVGDCPICHGTGMVTNTRGNMIMNTTCPTCGGRGFVITEKCVNCNGEGFTSAVEEKKINIPKGCPTGLRMRLADYGMPGINGGHNGNLYIDIEVEDDPKFTRVNDDLVTMERINYTDAINGNTIVLKMWKDDLNITIPKCYTFEEPLIIPGKGFNGGNLKVFIQPKVPKRTLTIEETAQLMEL